jgi:hypothetical protein
MPPVGFEPAVPASKRTQTQPLNRAATGIGKKSGITENTENNLFYYTLPLRNKTIIKY